ncbi:GCN5-related N-acetyltransferase [Ktedonobacter racemifer DSM 44963]|uniref:GCN5-related N-acetyltransferase n=2 Tax=Ktedonobacter racemifer TaxID=363277 RepID=D6U302_KTERA|nr:GCN5-related N-acetyltransferase [Ktedonobacter racemifer DSM 44963]
MLKVFDLVSSFPLVSRHTLDLPWRLSAPVINEGHDGSFWIDTNGRVVGFAAWQYYWAALDFFILPGPTKQEVEAEIFAWAEGRMRECDVERGYPLPYWVEFRDDDAERLQLVKAHGFVLEDNDSYTLFQHALDDLAPVPELSEGFVLRPLMGEQEVADYAELHRLAFESASMTSEWRARSLCTPQYRSDLDLVICAPDGLLAAFCVGWYDPGRHVAQIEPIGVHPRFRRHGLARTLLLTMLHRFKLYGATSAFIEPFSANMPIHRASEAVGFQRVHTIHRLGKWVNQPV